MKKVLLTLLSLATLSVAQAQTFENGDPGFVADYEAGKKVYCGAQGSGFYDGAGGHIKATFTVADSTLALTYSAKDNTSIGWFSFAVPNGNACESMAREKDPAWGADLTANPTTEFVISVSGATTADTLYTYIGYATGWGSTTSTYNTTGNSSGKTLDAKIPLVNGDITQGFTYAGGDWDNWAHKNKVNGFGFELKNANPNLKIILKKVAVGDLVQTSIFEKVYKNTSASVYVNYDANEATALNVSSAAVLTLKNLSGMTAKSVNGSVVNLNGLNAGLYILEVNDNGSLSTAKVIVK